MKNRVFIIDVLRGIVILLMTWDHVREYIYTPGFNLTDIEKTNPVSFFSRWITHFCAPSFVLLAGISVSLISEKLSKIELTKRLLIRGLWLIIIELTVIKFAWGFSFNIKVIYLQVIWAIGASMIFLGLLHYLPKYINLLISLTLIFCHNLFDNFHAEPNTTVDVIWHLFHEKGLSQVGEIKFYVLYPILPYIGIMLLGFLLGDLFKKDSIKNKTQKKLIIIGSFSLLLFIILRYINEYGDFNPWIKYESFSKTLMSYLNVSKYPPSLLFTLLTLGGLILTMGLLFNVRNSLINLFAFFGKISFFYYIIHIYLAHLFALFSLMVTNKINGTNIEFFGKDYEGYSLWYALILTIIIVILIYLIGKPYLNFKKRNKGKWWVSYI